MDNLSIIICYLVLFPTPTTAAPGTSWLVASSNESSLFTRARAIKSKSDRLAVGIGVPVFFLLFFAVCAFGLLRVRYKNRREARRNELLESAGLSASPRSSQDGRIPLMPSSPSSEPKEPPPIFTPFSSMVFDKLHEELYNLERHDR
jgi:hypothetical protein